MSKPKSKVIQVRVPGPLAPLAAGFKSALLDAGYSPLTAVVQLQLMVHLSRWLQARQLTAAGLTADRIEEYLLARRAAGYTGLFTHRGLVPMLEFFAVQGLRPPEPPAPAVSPADTLLAGFEKYLLTERALNSGTTSAYLSRAMRFVNQYAPDGRLDKLTAAEVTRAVSQEAARVSVGAVQYFVAALRALLRYAHVHGLVGEDLSAAALAVTGRRFDLLPKGLSQAQTSALLRSCDRRRAMGRRDYAILLTLLRLGLRAGEVAALRLDDIDWRAGQIVVHGKGRRIERLPLPADVGEAITGYLRLGRPAATACREVFLTQIAPLRALTRGSVSLVVRRACVRAGLPVVGAHRLRHTMACNMIRAQVPLAEIGQVLRHRSHITTAAYARVDLEGLRSLAQPWPGEPR